MEIQTREQYDWALKVLSLLMNAPMNPDRIKSGFFEGLCWIIEAYEEKVTTTVPTQKRKE
jgi:antitoxin component HigA of HigAB toxin-antitoxin module